MINLGTEKYEINFGKYTAFSKEDILKFYLNEFLTAATRGIEAARQSYFNKSAKI